MSSLWRILVALDLVTVSVFCLTADEIEAERSGWSVAPGTQYHIQTDEGPERYFRFQTLSGQYRKEKRLEDGTVVGTEGWLDPLGYLRIKDYVADSQGYRILRSKTVFVGKDRPIQEAVSVSKKVPAQSGILVTPQRPPNPFRQPELKDVTGNGIEANTVAPQRATPSTLEPTPAIATGRYDVPETTAAIPTDPYGRESAPALFEDGYSQPNTNYLLPGYQFQSPYVSPYRSPYPYHIPPPSEQMQPPLYDGQASQPLPVQVPSAGSPYGFIRPQYGLRLGGAGPSDAAAGFARNTTGPNYHQTRYPGYDPNLQSPAAASSYQSGTPELNRGTEYPLYDGTHEVKDGFQYYLKTHYHEEQEQPQRDKKIGSFGYVDPFGIRRVVYYSADPQNGFVHKKNNRYVGFDANPYDPKPRPTSR